MKHLFEAIQAGDAARVKELLDANATLANARDENGASAFVAAIYNKQKEVADLLAERGAMIDVFAAAMSGRTEKLREIVTANRSWVKAISADGWTPLHLAAYFGHADAAATLLHKGADVNARSTNAMRNTPLHAGVAGRNPAIVKLLLDFGADVNAAQAGGWTPLHAAAQGGLAEIAELLLRAGADRSLRAANQQTAADLALTNGHAAVVEILERQPA
jgi:ankyrin repeat protein